jgi:hypothetical protein
LQVSEDGLLDRTADPMLIAAAFICFRGVWICETSSLG